MDKGVFNEDGVQVNYYRQGNPEEKQNQLEERMQADPYDAEHPSSMINSVPEWFKKRMLSPAVQQLMALDETELEREVKPNVTLRRIRSSFWYEYERMHSKYTRTTTRAADNISVYKICHGVCTTQFFMDRIFRNDYYFAWMIRPPQNYTKALNESLEHGLSRVREILNFPLYEKKFTRDGEPVVDPKTGRQIEVPSEKNANLILKTVAFLDLRVKGAVTQKIHQISQHDVRQQTVSYNVHNNNPMQEVDASKLDSKLLTIDDLDKRIESLTAETQKLLENPTWSKAEVKQVMADGEEKLLKRMEETGHTEQVPFDYDPEILKRHPK